MGFSPVTQEAYAQNGMETMTGEQEAQVQNDIELTPEEEEIADEMYEQYLAIEEVLNNLDEEDHEVFIDALLDPEFDSSQFDSEIVVAESEKEVDSLNEMFTSLGSSAQFSEGAETVKINTNGDLVAANADGDETITPYGLWDATKCTAAIAAVAVPGAQAYRAIRALGGVRETVRLLAGASTVDDWLAIGGGTAVEILGIAGVEEYCFN